MLETGRLARRAAVLPAASVTRGAVVIRPLGAQSRFSLRTRPATAEALGTVAGFTLALPINRMSTAGERTSLRLGPDEWLLIGPEAETDELAEAVSAEFGERVFSLVDVSHRNVGIEITGRNAAHVLNAGCPLDLAEAAFPVGMATRTVLGKAEIVLARTGVDAWRVECWRSFATYVHGFLGEGALDFVAVTG
ncbi:sarcosine oxidase subunit gamma [Mangrovibrevibacter kandeliae]|uniref:sarcosine oxidase subunit gamma n=1 Tax=Mangrovibrevibacter kandeliae TaxID=2968473 RepID=UPI0021187736|nr:sarcosine oxidase subunit gamma family protein [Aurantimonas sp. CSK15Z-1]MCQ8780762.1 sarcosine oxidase subunit gamma [Aurantimonas sp. CSK15Z-1]